jgi:peptidoglycan/LPS O-acetylase OafA/YrhL
MQFSTTTGPRTSRDPALDGLRGFAVLLAFLFHFGGGLSSPNPLVHGLGIVSESGWIGVVLFFALSGFLITGSLWDSLNQSNLLRNFYARRALRILPLYYFVLAFATISSIVRGAPWWQVRRFTLFAFFLQNFPVIWARALQNPSPVPLYHLWSIAVEEQFYLIWPLVLIFAVNHSHSPRRGAMRVTHVLLGCALLFLATAYGIPWIFLYRHHFDYFLFTQAGALLMGAALALRMRSRGRHTHIELDYWALPAFLFGLSLYLLCSLLSGTFYLITPAQLIVGLPGISLAAAALIPLALRPGHIRTVLSSTQLRFIGRISYGVYVYQLVLQPVIHRLMLHLVPSGRGSLYFGVRFVLAFALTILTATLSFYLLERPFLKLKHHFPMHQPLP